MEPTISQTKKYPCPQCNAELVFDAAQGMMVCNYCGYKAPVEQTGSMAEAHTQTQVDQAAVEEIREHDLQEWIERLAKAEGTGWGTETKSFKCRSCNAVVSVEPNVTATVCPFCGSHHVIAQQESSKLIRPESLIPFQIDQQTAIAKFRAWLGKSWFRPNEVKKIANNAEARIQGVYLPFWTFDAQTFSRWWAEAGYYYYVTERYTVTVNGRPETRTRQVRHVRWEPASGTYSEFFDDVLVYATRSVKEKILQRIYPFDTKKLVPYRPQYLAGWRAEEYQIDLQEGWKIGRSIIDERLRAACGAQVPGDTYRNLRVQTQYSNLTFKHVLLPVWIASYRFNEKVYHFMVNGQTGKVSGEAPISWWKVALVVFIVLVLLACILLAMAWFENMSSEGVSLMEYMRQWVAMAIPVWRLPV